MEYNQNQRPAESGQPVSPQPVGNPYARPVPEMRSGGHYAPPSGRNQKNQKRKSPFGFGLSLDFWESA